MTDRPSDRAIDRLRAIVADDSHAMLYHTLGNYRAELLKLIDAAAPAPCRDELQQLAAQADAALALGGEHHLRVVLSAVAERLTAMSAAPEGAQPERGAFYVCPACHGIGNVTRETFDAYTTPPRPQDAMPRGVKEALQRMIEDGLLRGPASAEDARLVQRWAEQVATPPQPQPHDAAQLARRFHDEYERLAPAFGYETRADTRQFDPESPNGRLMIAVCAAIAGSQDAARDREDAERLEYMFRRYGWDRLENPRGFIDAARGAGAEGLANG